MATQAQPTPTTPRRRRWLKRLIWGAAICLLLITGGVTWLLLTSFAEPPALTGRPAILDAKIQEDQDGTRRLGRSWFRRLPGRSLLYLEGEPFTLGYSNASLTRALLAIQEQSLVDTVRRFLPNKAALYGTAFLVLVNNRRLPQYVPLEYQHEIHGLSRDQGPDPYAEFGPRYHRILNYHAAHDISHWVWDQPNFGCTAFAAAAPHTVDGNLLVGRNFDWESGSHFDHNKVIACYRPSTGATFLSVSWPGMAGAVTGLNEHKIFCSINGAHTEHMGLGVGRPVSLVLRQVLQYAVDLDSAARIIQEAPVFCADSFLVADGKTGTALVVEKTPKTSAVRRMQRGLLLQANHFESPELSQDQGNLRYLRDGSTRPRHQRLSQLLQRHSGDLDPQRAAGILRDRRPGPGMAEVLDHRGCINPMIATHSVVCDVSAGILWVSEGPHQLGAYRAYRIKDFGGAAPAATIPADPWLSAANLQELAAWRQALATAQELLQTPEGQDLDSAALDAALAQARQLNPDHPDLALAEARTAVRRGQTAAAIAAYRRALELRPPFGPVRRQIHAALDRLENPKQP